MLADGGGIPGEEEERRLEGVLRVVPVVEHPPADGQDHRPVAPDEGLEGGLVLPVGEGAEQAAVGLPPGGLPAHQAPDVPENIVLDVGHDTRPHKSFSSPV